MTPPRRGWRSTSQASSTSTTLTGARTSGSGSASASRPGTIGGVWARPMVGPARRLRGGSLMRRLLVLLALLAILVLPASPALGQPVVHVTGGGAGTFSQDLDGDGDIDGSRFGIGVVIAEAGMAAGHFECLMAGASDILGLPLMAVEAKVTAGSADPRAGTAAFGG